MSVGPGAGNDHRDAAPLTVAATVDGGQAVDVLDSRGGRVSPSGSDGDNVLRAVGPSVSLSGGSGAERLE